MNERIIKFIKDNKKNSSFYFSKKKLSKIFENPIDNLRISGLNGIQVILYQMIIILLDLYLLLKN